MSRYYRLLLDDYSTPGFVSFEKNYYGTLEQINAFFEGMKSDEEFVNRQKYILSIYEQYLDGNKKINHNVAYRNVPFLIPAKVLATDTSQLVNYAWKHLNTWRCKYVMKCDKVECTHIWFSCYGRYTRCIQARFINLQYENGNGKYECLGDMIWGYPGVIVGENGNLRNTVFVEEKVFKNKAEAIADRENFSASPDPIFDKFMDDIFGDG